MAYANITIYYGFRFNSSDIKTLFPKEIPKYLDIEETEFEYENCCYLSYFFPLKEYFTITKNIKYTVCDFDNDDGEEMLVIGCILYDEYNCHYSGICEVPEITEKEDNIIKEFLQENPKLNSFKPKIYIYLNQNK